MAKIKDKKRRRLEGVVISDKMLKTRVVEVSRVRIHPKYLKRYATTARFKAHDEANAYKAGDHVVIEETRPLSREKRWRIVGLVRKSEQKLV
ncbi:MAG: 30S ribosomal protein S17 [Candidatus Colwellbacteria bacterium CG_4_9_14_0_2_um_filter_50_12]|uniref:Small ribosomal subunit protein uS17 n=1 Tax=Candidatus Colwellbacteria bacterium CG_4_9_14_0_2_um_filter_50_12 TaxID=1974538 RepID=A0A2M8G125_9BACT|nr:MAG: 30S ribosomal protein S17 [Candidatus Colwellbacteria bacterium CG_4_9_14_0_2_um_filter_50_12]